MKENLQYESQTFGLWPRFISKLIAAWVVSYFLVIYILTFSGLILFHNYIILFIMVPLLMAVTWFVWKEIPLNWNNTLFVDFKNEKIKIYPRRLNRKEQGILDFDGMQISFNEINFYSAEVYDSFIFSSYYLVTVNVNHKTIKCISFKEADKYTDFLKIMSELGIQLKENNSSHK